MTNANVQCSTIADREIWNTIRWSKKTK